MQSTMFLFGRQTIWHKRTRKMLYGDYMFLSRTLLKLYGAINGHY